MRNLLLLALLLYDIFAYATRPNIYDYDDLGGDVGKTRHSNIDEKRREWKRKNNLKDLEHKEWEDRNRRHDYDNRYFDDLEKNFALEKGLGQERRAGQDNGIERGMGQERGASQDRPRDRDNEVNYRRRYDEIDKLNMALATKSAEVGHSQPQYIEKEPEKKALALSCDRQHERYEACFAGCAAVSCDNPRDRLRPCYPFCEPGCVCVPPYVRDDRTHKCVMPDECSKGLKGIPDLGDES